VEGFIERGGLWVAGQTALFVVYALTVGLPDVSTMRAAPWTTLGGLLAVAMGAAIAIWAVVSLRPSLTAFPVPTRDNVLVTDGPFRFVRHPIYSGLLLALSGWAVAANRIWALAVVVVMFAFFNAKARFEERHLKERHPAYASYMKQTRWRVIPGL